MMESEFIEETGLEVEVEIEIYKRRLNLQRQIMEKLRVEMEKRDKILDLLVAGGDVTLVNSSENNDNKNENDGVSSSGTKTFELLIKQIPYQIEMVTLNHINWDELFNSLEREKVEISLLSQDIKWKPDPKLTDANVHETILPRRAKRRFSESDETATAIWEDKPVEKQPRIEKNDSDFLPQLPEYSIDRGFFENQNLSTKSKSTTSKFLIRLHDNDVEKIRLYEINHDLLDSSTCASNSAQKFQLSLQEIQAAISVQKVSNPGSKLQIWCDVKNFDIFSSSSIGIQSFFQLFGELISHFSFCLYHQYCSAPVKGTSSSATSGFINSNSLVGFILQNFPNLEYLSINCEMLTNLDTLNLALAKAEYSKPLKLQSLKTLKIVQSKKGGSRISGAFLAKLLKRAPQLESIYGFPLNWVKETAALDAILMEDAIIEDPKSWIDSPSPKLKIQSLFLPGEIYYNESGKYSGDLLNLCNLETGTGNGRMFVALEEFSAQRYFIRDSVIRGNLGQLMCRTIQMNREFLKKLTLEPNSNPNTTLKIPRLENLKILSFTFNRANFPSFFPRGFSIKYAFPKLEQVEIFMASTPSPAQQQEPKFSPGFLCYGETFETVQSLTLTQILPPVESGCLTKMWSMFPHLTKLQLNNTLHETSRFLQHIFHHFPRLQQLILEIDTDSRQGNLDAAFTGINVDLCKTLEKFVPCPLEQSDKEKGKDKFLQMIRNGPALVDLKELRLLKFILRSGVAPEYNKIPVLTPVSLEYGFGAEQLENVNIFLDFRKKTSRHVKSKILTALEPILPFVTVL